MYWYWAFFLSFLPQISLANCTCGYLMTDPHYENETLLFTNILDSDFSGIENLQRAPEWVEQQFNVSAEAGRGKFGKSFLPENVFIRTETHARQDDAFSRRGLGLRVRSQVTPHNAISAAEVDTKQMDMLWGSYRAIMKLSRVSGTCAAFFWYFNDTQEIDMEFLSRQFDGTKAIFPVNLVIHSRLSAKAGYDASKTGTFKTVNLTFDPTEGFHEYRFDYLPGRVRFFADSKILAEMKGESVPSSAGHIILQHWSNGNSLWSGGPPVVDTVVLVRSVKAYFNASDVQKSAAWDEVCRKNGSKGSVCAVPDTTLANTSKIDDPSRDIEGVGNHNAGEENRCHRSHQAKSMTTVVALMVVVYTLLLTGMTG